MSMSQKRSLWIAGAVLSCMLIGGCAWFEKTFTDVTGQTTEQAAVAVQTEAEALMIADGIVPADATPEVWQDYYKRAGKAYLDRLVAENSGPVEKIIGVSLLQFPIVGIAFNLLVGLVRKRGQQNIANAVSGTSKLASVDALLLGGHSPPAVLKADAADTAKVARESKKRAKT